MKQFWASSLLLVAACITLGCGGGSLGRQLQSITITQTATSNGEELQFVATGTFSAPPTTVTPLSVDWTIGLMAPPPLTYTYRLTTQPYVFNCTTVGPEALPVVAFAPPDPNAPSSGITKTVVTQATTPTCIQGGKALR
jgi:hypothetical protein